MDTPTSSGGARLRILLADDHEPFRQRVRKLLRRIPDLELVGEAGDGEEVVRLAGELQPDIVIMDVVMPRLSGIEATRRITREFPALKLTASDAAAGDQFGNSVAVSGTTAVVGAIGDDDAGASSGSAYVFDCSSFPCVEEDKLTASDAAAVDVFGTSVAVSGTTAVVGARNDDDAGASSGSAYVFDLDLTVPFAVFEIDRARVDIDDDDVNEDRFEVRGFLMLGAASDGIDLLTEEVTVVFDSFTATLPPGSCVADGDEFECNHSLPGGGRVRFEFDVDGEYRVRARDIALPGFDPDINVFFSLQIGDDSGEAMIDFDGEDRFRALNQWLPEMETWLAKLQQLITPWQSAWAVGLGPRTLACMTTTPSGITYTRASLGSLTKADKVRQVVKMNRDTRQAPRVKVLKRAKRAAWKRLWCANGTSWIRVKGRRF